jgi:hypothetical protein
MPQIHRPIPIEQAISRSTGTTLRSASNADQKVHTTKADEAFPDRRFTSLPPQRSDFLDTPSVEAPSAVEHDRSRQDEDRPLCPWHAPRPYGCHQVHPSGIMTRNQCHVDDADDERWDREDEREHEPVKETLPFAKPHTSCAFLERWRMVNGHTIWG